MSTRRLGVLLLVAGALGTLATAAATWWTAPVDAVGSSTVSADGLTAVPLAGPLLLVVAAGVVARLLARGVLARIVDWLVVLAAAGLVQQLVAGAGRAESALATAAAEATGVPVLAGEPSATPWPGVAVGCSVLLLAGAVLLALAPARPVRGDRFERVGAAAPSLAVAEVPDGVVPDGEAPDGEGVASRGATGATGRATAAGTPEASDRARATRAAVDDWDALTRGEDPSARG